MSKSKFLTTNLSLKRINFFLLKRINLINTNNK